MMMRPILPLEPGESLFSWVNRFGLFHCALEAPDFLKLIGVQQTDLLSGKQAALDRLAEASGLPGSELSVGTYQKDPKRLFHYQGEQLFREFLNMKCIKFCPSCLLSDIEENQDGLRLGVLKSMWLFSPIRTCEIHQQPLIQKRVNHVCHVFNEYSKLARTKKALEELAHAPENRKPSDLQLYASSRLNKAQGASWMDDQQIDLACRATEMLGACIEFGAQINLAKFTEDDWDMAGHVGFKFTSRGEDGVREGLDMLYNRAPKTNSRIGPRGTFGRLYEWAQGRKNQKPVGPILDVLREYILDKFHIEAGTELLGAKTDRPRRHTVASLSSQYGLHSNTVAYSLQKSGLLPRQNCGGGTRNTVTAEPAEQLFDKLARAIPVAKISNYIGCTRAQASLLVKSGILKQVIPDVGDSSGRHKGVDAEDLNNLLEQIRAFGQSVSKPSVGMFDIGEVSNKLLVPSMDILSLVLKHELKMIELLPAEMKFRAVLVNADEVAKKAGRKTSQIGLTVSEAAKKLRLHPKTVRFLLQAQHYNGRPVLRVCGQVRHMGQMLDLIDPISVRQFHNVYCKLSKINGYWAREPDRLRSALEAKDIKPAWNPEIAGAELYRISEL